MYSLSCPVTITNRDVSEHEQPLTKARKQIYCVWHFFKITVINRLLIHHLPWWWWASWCVWYPGGSTARQWDSSHWCTTGSRLTGWPHSTVRSFRRHTQNLKLSWQRHTVKNCKMLVFLLVGQTDTKRIGRRHNQAHGRHRHIQSSRSRDFPLTALAVVL